MTGRLRVRSAWWLATFSAAMAVGHGTKAAQRVDDASAYARRIGNKTYRSYSPQHGTQIEYLSAAGRAYLWYPGNAVVLAGEWRVEPDALAPKFLEVPPGSGNIVEAPQRFRTCYRYGANSYNPVTGSVGNKWECQGIFQTMGEARTGDVFGLARRREPPFVTDRRPYSYDQLSPAARR